MINEEAKLSYYPELPCDGLCYKCEYLEECTAYYNQVFEDIRGDEKNE